MKTLRNKFWALLLIVSVAFLSCKKEDRFTPYAESSYKSKSGTEDRTVISRNDWKITVFQIGKKSEVALLREYIFKFGRGEEIRAFTNTTIDYGKWTTGKKGEMVNIHFDSSPLNKLNSDWRILNKTAYDIELVRENRLGEKVLVKFQRFQRVGVLPTISEVPTDPEVPDFE